MDVDVAPIASLLANPTRASVIAILMSGRAHTAGELARSVKVSPPTMTSHLQRLMAAGVVEVRVQGRHRYYRLISPEIAQAFEALAAVSRVRPVTSLRASQDRIALARARTCYDHLAGRVACDMTATLLRDGHLRPHVKGYVLTSSGSRFLERAGVDVEGARKGRRRLAFPCMDWTERRDHVAGALGAALLDLALSKRWVTARSSSRIVTVTPEGEAALCDVFGVDVADAGAHGIASVTARPA